MPSAEFVAPIQPSTPGRFSIPAHIAEAAHVHSGKTGYARSIRARVTCQTGNDWAGDLYLTSGREVRFRKDHPMRRSAPAQLRVRVTW